MKILPEILPDGQKASFLPPKLPNGRHFPLESVQPAKNQQALVLQNWWILQKGFKNFEEWNFWEMCPKEAQKASFLGLFLGQQVQ